MSRRNKIIIGVIIIVVLLVLLTIWFMNRTVGAPQTEVPTQQQGEQIGSLELELPSGDYVDSLSQIQTDTTPQQVDTDAQQQASVKAMAISFVERMGSFSNQSNFLNIEELKPFMTDSMKSWADSYMVEQRIADTGDSEYFGITTHAIGTEFKEFEPDNGVATLEINTQRIEYHGSQQNGTVRYQKSSVNLIQSNGVWFINSVTWL